MNRPVVAVGLAVVAAGLCWQWLGRLPGDIRIEREGARFYFPLTTSILASALLSLLAGWARKP